jgi:hypothetical protein
MRRVTASIAASITVAASVAFAVPAAAQQHTGHAAQASSFPAGWQGRVDRANQNIADVQFMRMGEAFHVVTGPHVILWNPANTAKGNYRVRGTFAQARAPQRAEGFGIVAGGQNLDQPNQDYLYFLMRHDGRFMVRHRAGDEVHTLADWTEHAAIRKPGATTGAENTLEIVSLTDRVEFVVNGTTVFSLQRAPMLNTDGIAGFRVGHHLDVQVRGFGIAPLTP